MPRWLQIILLMSFIVGGILVAIFVNMGMKLESVSSSDSTRPDRPSLSNRFCSKPSLMIRELWRWPVSSS